jgi:ribose/xylose/arabinose/galactoside ABC-type transport system permease subunit
LIKAITIENVSQYGAYVILLALCAIGVSITHEFLTFSNLMNVIEAVSFLGIIACGMALVTYSGKLVDLSVPSVISLSGIVAILTLKYGLIVSIVLSVLAGSLVGIINGVVIGKFKSNAIIWTLAVNFVMTGLIRVFFGSTNIYLKPSEVSAQFESIARWRFFGYVPLSTVVMLVLIVVIHVVVVSTKVGKQLKLVGSAETVAYFTAIRKGAPVLIAFVASAATASVGGVFISSLSKSACYTYGVGYEFSALTAIVLSGVTLDGGRGSILGVLGGVLTIGLLSNILTLLGVGTFSQQMIKGLVFILVVWLTSFSMGVMEKQSA